MESAIWIIFTLALWWKCNIWILCVLIFRCLLYFPRNNEKIGCCKRKLILGAIYFLFGWCNMKLYLTQLLMIAIITFYIISYRLELNTRRQFRQFCTHRLLQTLVSIMIRFSPNLYDSIKITLYSDTTKLDNLSYLFDIHVETNI